MKRERKVLQKRRNICTNLVELIKSRKGRESFHTNNRRRSSSLRRQAAQEPSWSLGNTVSVPRWRQQRSLRHSNLNRTFSDDSNDITYNNIARNAVHLQCQSSLELVDYPTCSTAIYQRSNINEAKQEKRTKRKPLQLPNIEQMENIDLDAAILAEMTSSEIALQHSSTEQVRTTSEELVAMEIFGADFASDILSLVEETDTETDNAALAETTSSEIALQHSSTEQAQTMSEELVAMEFFGPNFGSNILSLVEATDTDTDNANSEENNANSQQIREILIFNEISEREEMAPNSVDEKAGGDGHHNNSTISFEIEVEVDPINGAGDQPGGLT